MHLGPCNIVKNLIQTKNMNFYSVKEVLIDMYSLNESIILLNRLVLISKSLSEISCVYTVM